MQQSAPDVRVCWRQKDPKKTSSCFHCLWICCVLSRCKTKTSESKRTYSSQWQENVEDKGIKNTIQIDNVKVSLGQLQISKAQSSLDLINLINLVNTYISSSWYRSLCISTLVIFLELVSIFLCFSFEGSRCSLEMNHQVHCLSTLGAKQTLRSQHATTKQNKLSHRLIWNSDVSEYIGTETWDYRVSYCQVVSSEIVTLGYWAFGCANCYENVERNECASKPFHRQYGSSPLQSLDPWAKAT